MFSVFWCTCSANSTTTLTSMDEKKVLDNCSPDMAALQSHLQPMAPVKFTNNAMLEKMQGTLCVAAKFTQN